MARDASPVGRRDGVSTRRGVEATDPLDTPLRQAFRQAQDAAQDAAYYTKTRDNRRVHVCAVPGHIRYWLNVGAALWICAGCHPPVGDVAQATVGEIVEAAKRRPQGGWRNADD